MKRQHGFSLVEGVLIIAVLAIFAAVGYLAYVNLWAAKKSAVAPVTSSQPVAVNDVKDLDTVDKSLNQLAVDDTDLNQLDSALNSF